MSLAGTAALLFAAAALASTLLCAGMKRFAPLVGLVDKPGGRKAHKAPTPLGGGVAFAAALGLVLLAGWLVLAHMPGLLPPEVARYADGLRSRWPELLGILGLSTLMMIMGLIDDRFGLPWQPRLVVQTLAAVGLVCLGVRATLFPPFSNVAFSGAVTVLWVVAMTNAFNFLDNMDGLAASVALIAALLFAGAQALAGSLFVPALLVVLAGSLAGFLAHNRPPARLFMGDAGSNFLGFFLAAMTVAGTFTRPYDREHPTSPYSVLTPLLVMAVPIYDMISVILIRIREGRSPFQADRRHFSHRLVERGLTPPRAVATMDFITLVAGFGALLLHQPWLSAFDAALVVGQTACLLIIVAILEGTTIAPAPATRQGPADGQGPSPDPPAASPIGIEPPADGP
ncbi:MAG: MraY family glycosyltransferase [Isosphaeraceae bacterium]